MSGAAHTYEPLPGGWDSRTYLVDGRWIEREPLRPEVARGLLAATRLIPWLAPELPLQVPVPVVVSAGAEPLRVRHRRVRGESISEPDQLMGRRLGQFLVAQHGKDVAGVVARGVPDGAATLATRRALVDRVRADVLPLLPAGLVEPGRLLLDRVAVCPADTLVHGDLGPGHLLVHAGRLDGVIDWTDAHVGDPALDLSWALHGASSRFAGAVAAAYGVDDELARRARDWHLLGPWHEVLHGLDNDQPAYVASGLEGTVSRLAATAP